MTSISLHILDIIVKREFCCLFLAMLAEAINKNSSPASAAPCAASARAFAYVAAGAILLRGRQRGSEIAEPGVGAALLERGVPAADGIERDDDAGPNEVNAGEVEAPVGRAREGILVERGRLEHPVDVAVADGADDDRDEVNQREVSNIKEERHFAVDERGAEKLRSAIVDGAEKKESGAEGHQQEQQRRRIFCRVQK